MKPSKFVGWFDMHFGWEKARVAGELKTVPTHDSRAIRSASKFLKDFQPDHFIMGGDNHNCSFLSRHNTNKPRLVEGFSAKREYNESDRQVITPVEMLLPKQCKKYWLLGNHEYWVELFLNEHPSLEGIIEPHKYLQLAKRGWQIVDYGQTLKIGKLFFAHGDAIRTSAMYIAKRFLEAYQRNLVIGHFHTTQTHCSTCLADGQPHMTTVSPMLGSLHPEYLGGSPTNWVQGFVYGYFWQDGKFNVYPVIMTDHKFAAEGRVYTP